MTSPPVQAQLRSPALAEPPARRPDRDRGETPRHAGACWSPGRRCRPRPRTRTGQRPSLPREPAPALEPGPRGIGSIWRTAGRTVRAWPGGCRPGTGRQERPQGQRGPSRPSPSPPPPPLSQGSPRRQCALRHLSGSSSSYGKRGSMRLRKSWPRQRRQQRQPKLELASRGRSRPRSQFRPEILPIRNRPTRSPAVRGTQFGGERDTSKLRDRQNVRHEGKVRRATTARDLALPQARQRGVVRPDPPLSSTRLRPVGSIFRVGDDLVDTCRRSRAKAKSSARPSDRRRLTKLGRVEHRWFSCVTC